MKRTIKCAGRTLEYTLIASRARQNALLQALPRGKVRLYAPAGASLRDMDRLVKERIAWLDEMHAMLDAEAPKAPEALPDEILLEGRRAPLCVREAALNRITYANGALLMQTAHADNAARRAQLKRWLCERALTRIREAVNLYAPGIPKPVGRIAIREQRTRWGSCSRLNNLNFNWKLILMPPEALTYVVIHELCHLIEFNHSPRFWQEVKRRMPEYEYWKKWIKTSAAAGNFNLLDGR